MEPMPQVNDEPMEMQGGPRIVINPRVFSDKRDALCVAMNEAFRVLMEVSGFDPVSEPTEEQREFFADTAYANDEGQLRRTIIARICTFDTSVQNPTDEQLQESVEFLESVMEMGAPQNEWEQRAVQRLHDVLAEASTVRGEASAEEAPPEEPVTQPAGETGDEAQMSAQESEEVHGDVLGGTAKDEEDELQGLAKLGEDDIGEEINQPPDERGTGMPNDTLATTEEMVAEMEEPA